MEKAEARRQIREALDLLGPEEREGASELIREHIESLPEFAEAQAVMLFASMADEWDTFPLIEESLRRGQRLYLPRVDWRRKRLLICRLYDPAELQERYMGIPEPPEQEQAGAEDLDFILVPGLGFDRMGNRLGRGAGYYDRLLSEPGLRAVNCGAAFEVQVLEYLPHGPSDRKVDLLVTEAGVFRFEDPGDQP